MCLVVKIGLGDLMLKLKKYFWSLPGAPWGNFGAPTKLVMVFGKQGANGNSQCYLILAKG
jgi:hypothetical protein